MRHNDLINQVELSVDKLATQIKNLAIQGAAIRTAKEFHDYEQQLMSICREFAGGITGIVLREILQDDEWTNEIVDLFKVAKGLRGVGNRTIDIETLFGEKVTVDAMYLAPKKTKRGAGGRGDAVTAPEFFRYWPHWVSCTSAPPRYFQKSLVRW